MESIVFNRGMKDVAGTKPQKLRLDAIRIGRKRTMSKTSFKTFCIEFYANHTDRTGPEVYAEFEKSGLLKELDDDYEDLHGMGMEAVMQMFDEYLGKAEAR